MVVRAVRRRQPSFAEGRFERISAMVAPGVTERLAHRRLLGDGPMMGRCRHVADTHWDWMAAR